VDVRRVIGENTRRFRLTADLSQEAVAERMGVDRAYISALELGKTNPTAITIWRLAESLGVKASQLLEDIPSPPAPRQRSSKAS